MPLTASRNSAPAARYLALLSLFTLTNLVDAVPRVGKSYSHSILKRGQSYVGCFSSSEPLDKQIPYKYQTPSYCSGVCAPSRAPVFAVSDGSNCWCGNELPAADTKVDDSFCNTHCDGYGNIMCGGVNYYSVYLSGTGSNIQNFNGNEAPPSSSSSSSSSMPSTTTTSAPTVVTSITPGRTIIVTEPVAQNTSPTASVSKSSGGGSSNTAAVAAGAVVGAVAFCSIVGVGTYLILRHRRRRQAEEEYRQRSQADFMRGIERKGSPSFSNASDSRMEPDAGRRNSVGSLADNHDYSRRILRVANPDSS